MKRFISNDEHFEDRLNTFLNNPTVEVIKVVSFTNGVDVFYSMIPTIDLDNYASKYSTRSNKHHFV